MTRFEREPLLAPFVAIKAMPEAVMATFDEVTIEFAGVDSGDVKNVLQLMDGSRPIDSIAAEAETPVNLVRDIVKTLHKEGFVLDTNSQNHAYDSAAEFYLDYRKECLFWSRLIFSQQFWCDLRRGALPHSTVIGWGIEFYHYVNHAGEYMPMGVAQCTESWQARQWFAQHYVEEANHGVIFLNGLMKCGLSRDRIETAPPLPATRALLNFLKETAMEGALPYAACFGLTQPEPMPPNQKAFSEFYEPLKKLYPKAEGLFSAFERHSQIDAELNHNHTIIEMIVESRQSLDRSERKQIIGAIRRLAEVFVLFFDQIYEFYRSPNCQIPRRAPDLAGLLSSNNGFHSA